MLHLFSISIKKKKYIDMNDILNSSISPGLILSIVIGYFAILMGISWVTSRKSDNTDFFSARRSSPWYLVAFGMIGASLSGVTFVSIPGVVGADGANQQFSYMQVVFGYLAGYMVVAFLLLPLYYRLNLTSIYTYLQKRFGGVSYKVGAIFFLISRIVGASFRLFLVAMVLDEFVLKAYNIPFGVTVFITIFLVWVYTYRAGIKTVVWTDTIQTAAMLIAVGVTIYYILDSFNGASLTEMWGLIESEDLGQVFFFEDGWSDPNNFFKQFFSGMFITIVMTGLDQDMMQKNLTCRTLRDAQKNMLVFSIILIIVNFMFLYLGASLAVFIQDIDIPGTMVANDKLYPTVALQYLPEIVGIFFIIGLIAAAYSSADSALTALTTSFCVDILGLDEGKDNKIVIEKNLDESVLDDMLLEEIPQTPKDHDANKDIRTRKIVHIIFAVILGLVILGFAAINDQSVINQLFKVAGYTYGPLLGLYAFGLFTKLKIADVFVPVVCIVAPVLTFIINLYSETLLFGYKFGFELLLVNGLLTFIGLLILTQGRIKKESIT